MTMMELLAACRRHGRDADSLADRIEEMEAAATSATMAVGGAGGHAGPSDKYSAYMARKDELERRLKAARRALAAEQMAAILLTGELPDQQRKALRGYYVNGKSAAAIARDSGYSVSSVYKAMAEGKAALAALPEARIEEALPGWYVAKYLYGQDDE